MGVGMFGGGRPTVQQVGADVGELGAIWVEGVFREAGMSCEDLLNSIYGRLRGACPFLTNAGTCEMYPRLFLR